MSAQARVDSQSPGRLVVAIRRLVADSERSASAAVAAVATELAAAERELSSRERDLSEARRQLAHAEAELRRCEAQRREDCGAFARAVADGKAAVRKQEMRVRAAHEAVGELRRTHDRAMSAHNRLKAAQARDADAAWRELAGLAAGLEAYLSGHPAAGLSLGGPFAGRAAAASPASQGGGEAVPASQGGGESVTASQGGGKSTPTGSAGDPGGAEAGGSVSATGAAPARFTSDKVASCWSVGFSTPAGRAYYAESDSTMRELAVALKPSPSQYTVDLHGSQTSVQVGGQELDAAQLAELVRADPRWQGRQVRLFSCETGAGDRPIAQELATWLQVGVTAPTSLAWSNIAGEAWVAPYEWRIVNGTLQRVPGAPDPNGWRRFDP